MTVRYWVPFKPVTRKLPSLWEYLDQGRRSLLVTNRHGLPVAAIDYQCDARPGRDRRDAALKYAARVRHPRIFFFGPGTRPLPPAPRGVQVCDLRFAGGLLDRLPGPLQDGVIFRPIDALGRVRRIPDYIGGLYRPKEIHGIATFEFCTVRRAQPDALPAKRSGRPPVLALA